MLKCELNGHKGLVKIEASGSLPELMADLTTLLGGMYDGINEEQKEDFVQCVKRMADDKMFTKSNEEMKELVKEEENKHKEIVKKLVDGMPEELLKLLKDIL